MLKNGVLFTMRQVSRALNGLSRTHERDLTQDNRVSRRVNGLPRAIVAVSRAVNGISRAIVAVSRAMNGVSRGMNVSRAS